MKTHKEITVIIVILFSIVAFVSGYYTGKELPSDNIYEQSFEDIIEHQMGLKIDLSPESDITD